jgi:hypothetical protein
MDADSIIKLLTGGVALLAPVAGKLSERVLNSRRSLGERHEGLKRFFLEGGEEQHPLLRESAFAVAMGHEKVSSSVIPLLLKQRDPLRFTRLYVASRDYLAPNADGTRFELIWLAKHSAVRRTLFGVGIAGYLLFVFFALWVALFQLPAVVAIGSWKQVVVSAMSAIISALAGVWCLVNASPLLWAKRLYDRQNET